MKDMNDNAPTIEIRGIGLVAFPGPGWPTSQRMWRKRQLWPWCRYLTETRERMRLSPVWSQAMCPSNSARPARREATARRHFLQTTTPLDYEKVKDYTIEIVARWTRATRHSPAPIPSKVQVVNQ